MQEALTPGLELRCGNPECEVMIPQPWKVRRKRYCSPACSKKVLKARDNERCASLEDKECRECQQTKLIDEFSPPSNLRCRACMKTIRQGEYERRGGKEYMYERTLATLYGMTVQEYQDRMDEQQGRCAICQETSDTGASTWTTITTQGRFGTCSAIRATWPWDT